ncbi:MAG: winged helix-turn-helix domain-containing protein [Rhizobiales bacterium]|nr:winged helix-turn-helix domain-containing protein [Hyphomicrobiales bacterium]
MHGVVRWRRVDLQRLIAERFGVAYPERTVGKIRFPTVCMRTR